MHGINKCCCSEAPPMQLPSNWCPGKKLLFCSKMSTANMESLLGTTNNKACSLAASMDMSLSIPKPSSYNFESEWKSACLARAAAGHVSLCPGIRDPSYISLLAMAAPGGQPSVTDLDSGMFPLLSLLWQREKGTGTPDITTVSAFCLRYDLFSYTTDAECIRSAFCSYNNNCSACKALAMRKSFKQRAVRCHQRSLESLEMKSQRLKATNATSTMSISDLHLLTADLRQSCQDALLEKAQSTKAKDRLADRVQQLADMKANILK